MEIPCRETAKLTSDLKFHSNGEFRIERNLRRQLSSIQGIPHRWTSGPRPLPVEYLYYEECDHHRWLDLSGWWSIASCYSRWKENVASYPLSPCSVTDISLATSSRKVMFGVRRDREVWILLYSRKKREAVNVLKTFPGAPGWLGY